MTTKKKPAAAAVTVPASKPPKPAKPETKVEMAAKLIRRKDGATLDELIAATGWKPHSVRAVISGLRKQGMDVLHIKGAAAGRYTVSGPA